MPTAGFSLDLRSDRPFPHGREASKKRRRRLQPCPLAHANSSGLESAAVGNKFPISRHDAKRTGQWLRFFRGFTLLPDREELITR